MAAIPADHPTIRCCSAPGPALSVKKLDQNRPVSIEKHAFFPRKHALFDCFRMAADVCCRAVNVSATINQLGYIVLISSEMSGEALLPAKR
jgi:hypothetical protein